LKVHEIKSITTHQHQVSLREPFITSLRRVDNYPVIQVRIELESGRVGVGECVATPAIAGDSVEEIWRELNSDKAKNLKEIDQAVLDELNFLPSSRAALDMACWDLETGESNCAISTDVTIPIAPLSEIPRITEERIKAGFKAFKIKVEAEPIDELIRRISLIYELVGRTSKLRIDPNQSWSLDYAKSATKALEVNNLSIEYLEQPLKRDQLAEHRELSLTTSIPLMADESCFSERDLTKVVSSNAFKFVNVKILKAGGVFPAQRLAKLAKESGLTVSIGLMMEGEQGVRAATHLAHEISPEIIHDLDAAWWFKGSSILYQGSTVRV
jgi:L-alanine-DL-glutamate epimerase-like enolase superfamily enzyme